ncbi:Aminoglycoside N(3)-acetyltransferase III [Bosea sp. 62]|uniref:aminoglycoside 3-N-acetyltransferase n=1 Tax=unclassified Bosea (in: a-proteobacteria) TaxID=2653178 RepID=UPI001251C060|nr:MULTISPECIES: aminoglycoside 3-N-acetyltransferase [unclassified Bosea (in: a-proteobacteria)]CAD5256134.1 Aminoglycoside N(3)-acetyltransferase III [Bosea sp. 46]CAD5260141.1 Aminoglycoside N(3)-acetyltransferase III [Bosea sp. 21B]CAD5280505.1 Aminoglycoside N(3)-acetyltransferase III [Bosea sp. 7B]VVT58201.1 Aminoglycoside N(3)-acetyltransferase III [Bosea sp. EC-HK365B]VXB48505.1 Aminoglycoside N(3)-acetyltransferase III [Bosea sp. 29B]
MASPLAAFVTRASLAADLSRLGLAPGDAVMVHAAVSKVGRLLDGPDTIIAALCDAVGPQGTVLAYADWEARYEDLVDDEGRVPLEWREHVPPFDPQRSRAIRDNGVLPEFLRTTPGARRSGNPGASLVALGAKAEWFTADHPLDYGYGAGSPLAKLVETGGKVLMLGAPLDTLTLLHHAEHLADIPGKRIRRIEVPLVTPTGTQWRMIEEFDTGDPIVAGLEDDYFAGIVTEFLATGQGRQGLIGAAHSVLVEAAAITAFGVAWLESRFGSSSPRL